MAEKKKKDILVVGQWGNIYSCLYDFFDDYNRSYGKYLFTGGFSADVSESVNKIRAQPCDVVVIDTWPEGEQAAFWLCRCLNHQFGPERPLKIFIDKPNFFHCIEAMQKYYAWDYIPKSDDRGRELPPEQIARLVADSVVKGLEKLDLRQELTEKIGGKWLGENWHWIEKTYNGQFVAIRQGEEGMAIVASGQDAFELEEKLFYWREEHPNQEPFVVRILETESRSA